MSRQREWRSVRAVFNDMIDRRPLAVVRYAGASDVVGGITFAREHDLVLSVRGGGHFPSGQLHYWKSGWLRHVTDEAIETMIRLVPQMPSPTTGVGLQHLDGAASRVDRSATAFPHRAEQYDFLILSQWPDAADSARNIEFTREFFEAMQPHLEDSVYVNNLGDEGQGRIRAAYGENYQRLTALKRKYDPANLFRLNQNIDPSPTDHQD